MMPPTNRAEANALAARWKASEQAYHDGRRKENRAAWRDYHLRQAQSVLEVARALSAKHLAAAAALELGEEEKEDG